MNARRRKLRELLVLLLVAAFFLPCTVHGASRSWDAGGAPDLDWKTAENWSDDTEPAADDTATVSGGYTAVVTSADAVAYDLDIGDSGTGTVQQTAGALTLGNSLTLGIGANDVGIVSVGNGILTVTNDVRVSSSAYTLGLVTLSDGAIRIGDELQIGYASTASGGVSVADGTLAVGDHIYIGDSSGSTGLLVVSGGTVTNDGGLIAVGNAGRGTLQVGGSGYVRASGTSSGSGAGDVIVGRNALSNAVYVSGGHLVAEDELIAGESSGDLGWVFVTGGMLTCGGDAEIGASGATGMVWISGSGHAAVGNNLSLGHESSGRGTLTLSNGWSTVTGNLYVGNGGIGTMTVHAGAVTAATVRISDDSTAAGSVLTVNGGSVETAGSGDWYMDYASTLTVSDGDVRSDTFYLGVNTTATVVLSNGTVSAQNDVNVGAGNGGSATVFQSGGVLDVDGGNPLAIGSQGLDGNRSGFYTITNGTIDIEAGSGNGDLEIGDTDSADGTGVFHVVGGLPSITVGDDLEMSAQDNGELRVTIVDDNLATITVGDEIQIDGTLTVSNIGTVATGLYVVCTSLNATAVSGTFDSTNWDGTATGKVFYDSGRVVVSLGPEIEILGTGPATVITNGDTTPDVADGTAFGSVVAVTGQQDHVFTVTNSDSVYTLSLTGDFPVSLDGPHADDFKVMLYPAVNIAPQSASTFTLRFEPSVVGVRTAEVSIANTDLSEDENPYTFRVTGTGTLSPQPTLNASNLTFTAVTNTAFTVSWASGNGENRLLAARSASVAGTLPVDGTGYAADAQFGNGDTLAPNEHAVYNNSGTSVTLTGLQPGTNYALALYEHNGEGVAVNYLTAGALTGLQATATYAPVISEGTTFTTNTVEHTALAGGLNASDVDLPQDTLTWSLGHAPGNGAATASGTGTSGSFTYQPEAYFSGQDQFQVYVTDKFGNRDIITIQVTVTAANTAGKPVFIFE